MPPLLVELLTTIAVKFLAWAVEWKKNNPDKGKVIEATPEDNKKWNDAVDLIDSYRRRPSP